MSSKHERVILWQQKSVERVIMPRMQCPNTVTSHIEYIVDSIFNTTKSFTDKAIKTSQRCIYEYLDEQTHAKVLFGTKNSIKNW